MGRAEAAAEGDDAGQVVPAVALLGQIAQLGHCLIHDVAQPLLIPADAPVGIAVGVRPCLLVQRVDGQDHDLARLDPRRESVCHVEVLEIEEAAILTGDVQHGPTPVPVDLALHLPAQRRAVFLEILHLHILSSSFLSQSSKIAPIKIAYLRYAVCGCCLCIKNANCYITARTSACGTRRAAAFPSWPRCGFRRARRGPSG